MHGRRRFLRNAIAALAAVPATSRAARRAPRRRLRPPLARDRRGLRLPREPGRTGAVRACAGGRAPSPRARARNCLSALEGAIAELNDEHVSLDAHLPRARRARCRWPPTSGPNGSGGEAVIAAVRAGSVADVSGAVPGMQVTSIQKTPVEQAVRALLHRDRQSDSARARLGPSPPARGPVVRPLTVDVRPAGRAIRLEIERQDLPPSATPPLIARRIGEERDLGYLRLKNDLRRGRARAAFRRGARQPARHARPDPRPARNPVGRLRRRRARAARAIRDGRIALDRERDPRREARRRRGRRAGLAARSVRLLGAHASCSSTTGRPARANRSPSASRRPRGRRWWAPRWPGLRGDARELRLAGVGHRPALSGRPRLPRQRHAARGGPPGGRRWTSSRPTAGPAIPSSTRR